MGDTPIQVTGIAKNAAMGAVVVTDEGIPYYIDGLDEWDDETYHKRIVVRGKEVQKKLAPDPEVAADGSVSHGMQGEATVLVDATWTPA